MAKKIYVPYSMHIWFSIAEKTSVVEALRRFSGNSENFYRFEYIPTDEVIAHQLFCKCCECHEVFPLSQKDSDTGENSISFSEWMSQRSISQANSFQLFDIPQNTICPSCKKQAKITSVDNAACYQIFSTDGYTVINQKISLPEQYLPSLDRDISDYDFPITANMVFYHQSHRTVFYLLDNSDIIQQCSDITEDSSPCHDTAMYQNIYLDNELKQTLSESFISQGIKVPFSLLELDADQFITLNRFSNFPHSFYTAIPYRSNSRVLDSSFSEIEKRLHRYDDIETLYSELALPNKKQYRKAIFSNPALLFYVRELQQLPFKNYDIVITILNGQFVYELLALLHNLPKNYDYISAMISEIGEIQALKFIYYNLHSIVDMAAMYSFLPEDLRSGLFKKNGNCLVIGYAIALNFNRAVLHITDTFDDEIIDGYLFTLLKNTNEYDKAANDLHNCLSNGFFYYDSVYGVVKNGVYVAAINVDKCCVTDAYTIRDRDIKHDDKIYHAFLQWTEKHNLSFEAKEEGEATA